MTHTDRGRGYLNLFFTLVVLGAVAYAALKIVPVYVHNYELQDHIRQVAIQASVERTPAEAIQNNVVDFARDLELPVTREDVKVMVSGTKVTIAVDYRVPIDLRVYTLELHFTPSAENRAL